MIGLRGLGNPYSSYPQARGYGAGEVSLGEQYSAMVGVVAGVERPVLAKPGCSPHRDLCWLRLDLGQSGLGRGSPLRVQAV